MNNHKSGLTSPVVASVAFFGESEPVAIQSLSIDGAVVRMHAKRPIWIGRFLALLIGDLPAIPADVRAADGATLTIVFRTALHPSVLEDALQMLDDASRNSAV